MPNKATKKKNARRRCIRCLDGELNGLSIDCAEAVRVLDKVEAEMVSCGPTTRRGIHSGGAESSVDQGGKGLRRKPGDVL